MKAELDKVLDYLISHKDLGDPTKQSLFFQYAVKCLGKPDGGKINEAMFKTLLEHTLGKAGVKEQEKEPPPDHIIVEFDDGSIGGLVGNQESQDSLPSE